MNIIFNDGGNGSQTGDMALNVTKNYFFGSGTKAYSSQAEVLEAVEAQSQKVASEYSLSGSMQGWTPGKTPFYTTADENIVALEIELAAGTYEFKISKGNNWDVSFGNGGTINDTTGENWWVMDAQGNCKIVATGGTYLFKYNISENKIHVTKIA